MGLEPYQCLYVYIDMDGNGSAAMLPVKKSAEIAPKVNLRDPLHIGEEACKQGIHPSFENQGRCHDKI